MKFAERLTIELKGIKQTELAAYLGIRASNISDWKKGKYKPSLDVFYKLCTYLDVSADYLLGLNDA